MPVEQRRERTEETVEPARGSTQRSLDTVETVTGAGPADIDDAREPVDSVFDSLPDQQTGAFETVERRSDRFENKATAGIGELTETLLAVSVELKGHHGAERFVDQTAESDLSTPLEDQRSDLAAQVNKSPERIADIEDTDHRRHRARRVTPPVGADDTGKLGRQPRDRAGARTGVVPLSTLRTGPEQDGMETLNRRRERIEEHLEAVLEGTEPAQLREQMQQATLSGGKRVRPTLTVLVCDALRGDIETATEFAVGIELVHNASLVVDDIIDESELRRGGPSAWQAYGHGPAIVTSDGLLGKAFGVFGSNAQAIKTVSEALVHLGEGEATELMTRPVSGDEYARLARRKTGALFRAAAELGAIAADADPETVEAFGRYAERVGVAFQIRDDVLDVTADAEQLGKPGGRDEDLERPSIVEVTDLSPAEADERARAESAAALEALRDTGVADSRSRTYLEQLANFVVERER